MDRNILVLALVLLVTIQATHGEGHGKDSSKCEVGCAHDSCPIGEACVFDGCNSKCQAVEDVCGGHLTGNEGTITSPGYPGHYPDNKECTWFISVPPPCRIEFVLGTLRLESSSGCMYDSLQISAPGMQSSTFCGIVTPKNIVTPGSTATINFKSDRDSNDEGFSVSYTKKCEGADLDQLIQRIARVEERNDELEEKCKRLEERNDWLEECLNNTKTELMTEISNNMSGMNNNMSEMRSDMSGMSNNMSELEECLNNTKTELSGMSNNMSEMRSDMSEMRSDMSEKRSDMSEMSRDMSELRRDMAEMMTDMEELMFEIDDLKLNESTLNITVTEMRSDVDELKDNFGHLDNHVTSVTSNIERRLNYVRTQQLTVESCTTSRVAFTAVYEHEGGIGGPLVKIVNDGNREVTALNNQVVKYNNVMHNLGNAYTPATGQFRAIIPGVYGFTVYLRSGIKGQACVMIRHNTHDQGKAHVNEAGDTDSISVTLHLQSGDTVDVVACLNHNDFDTEDPNYNRFIGILLSADTCDVGYNDP